MVRLKAGLTPSFLSVYTMFQFLMVRLKELKSQIYSTDVIVVSIPYGTIKSEFIQVLFSVPLLVSIPYGTIKSSFRHW